MLDIVIPSRSRPYNQITLNNLARNLWGITTIVAPEDQYQQYRDSVPDEVVVLPFEETGISDKRNYILHSKEAGKVIMLDDDLQFYKRDLDGSRFSPISQDQTNEMIESIVDYLDRYPMVGLTDKFMSHTRPRNFVECSRFNQVLGFNRELLPSPWPTFRIPHDEEHDVHLQLLTRGCKTAVLTEFTKSDRPNSPGGCSDWRNAEVLKEVHTALVQLWPGIVTITEDPKQEKPNRARYNWREAKRVGGIV